MVPIRHLIYLHPDRHDLRTPRRGVPTVQHRVIQWGTGNTGAHTLRFLLEDPAFDVVGVWVNREQNVGRTAGELARSTT
jgi:hypothetical protein